MYSDNHPLFGSSVAFPEHHPTPFPESADFFYDNLIPPPEIDQPLHLPPQKLRPIRHNARSLTQDQSDSVAGYAQSTNGCTFPELGFMSESHLSPDFQFHSTVPEAGGADDLLTALRQINPAQGFDFIISELKKQIPPLDSTSSSSMASDNSHDPANRKTNLDLKSNRSQKRKRMESFLEDLMMQVVKKQEQMHKQLIEAMEKREAERVVREEAWRKQEIELANKEEAIRAQEASRSLALISFIQNAMGSEDTLITSPPPLSTSEEAYHEAQTQIKSSNKTWPKSEVQTLIALRCAFDARFRDVDPKTSLWKEISFGLNKMGYRRSARKCREKWSYINKYYKSFVENGIAHSENGESCPYFEELEILYRNGFIS